VKLESQAQSYAQLAPIRQVLRQSIRRHGQQRFSSRCAGLHVTACSVSSAMAFDIEIGLGSIGASSSGSKLAPSISSSRPR
jgi:hypothetical protein